MSTMDRAAMNDFNANIITEFRANGGKVTGPFAGAPLMLLTTTGAKSGNRRTIPIVYTRDGDRYIIIASKGGAPTNPDWYHNLVAHPEATIEVGTDRFEADATIPAGDERERLFRAQAALMPNFAEYEQMTTRVIPVVALTPQGCPRRPAPSGMRRRRRECGQPASWRTRSGNLACRRRRNPS